MVFGKSKGVRGHGMDHTRRFPRTLAGFGLTWHGGSRFSCFLGILETHFITKYLRIGPRASRLVLGFLLKARAPYKTHYFSEKGLQTNIFSGNMENLPKSSLCDKMASFCLFFQLFCFCLIFHGFSMDRFSMDFP